MQEYPFPKVAAVVVSSTPSMQIPIQLIEPLHTLKAVNTQALVDSGTGISCIDWGFVCKHHLPTEYLTTSIHTQNVDNSINKKRIICFTSILFLNINGITQ
jgi:hypothetical protein